MLTCKFSFGTCRFMAEPSGARRSHRVIVAPLDLLLGRVVTTSLLILLYIPSIFDLTWQNYEYLIKIDQFSTLRSASRFTFSASYPLWSHHHHIKNHQIQRLQTWTGQATKKIPATGLDYEKSLLALLCALSASQLHSAHQSTRRDISK